MNIATFQKSNLKSSLESVVSNISEDLSYCDSLGIDIVCFPECYLTGYYLKKEDIEQNAISLKSSQFLSLVQTWSDFKVTFILGLIEKNTRGCFNSAAVISQGKLLGCYRKTYPNEKYFLAGEIYPVFMRGATFGINICSDANYPYAAKQLAKQGAKILFYPLNNFLPKNIADKWRLKSPDNLQKRAQENRCWVVSSDVAGSEKHRISYGCTQIVSPSGKVVASVPELEEGLLCATLYSL